MRKLILSICAVLAIFVTMNGNAYAAGKAAKSGIVESHARISPTMIPITSPGKMLPETRAVFPVLTVPERNFADGRLAAVCQREAHVKEAIVQYFQKKPAPMLRSGHIDEKALEKQKRTIAGYVNRRLSKPLVSEVIVLAQDPNKGTKRGLMSRFPSARGCSRVANEFIELMKNRALGGGKDSGDGGGGH